MLSRHKDLSLECSEGTSPIRAAKLGALSNRKNPAASHAIEAAVTVSMPFSRLSASHIDFLLGFSLSPGLRLQPCFLLVGPMEGFAVVVERGHHRRVAQVNWWILGNVATPWIEERVFGGIRIRRNRLREARRDAGCQEASLRRARARGHGLRGGRPRRRRLQENW